MAPTGSASPTLSVARFVLSFDGVEVAFSELIGISSDVQPVQYVTGSGADTKQFGTNETPTVTLKRGVDGGSEIWDWHVAVRAGDPTARRTCVLKFVAASGQTLLTFLMENAWPSKVDIAGLQSGQSRVLTETDEFVCDSILIQPG